MLDKLRESTAELHREIEKENLAGLIVSHKISLNQYKLLLLQNYTAYRVTETQIGKFLDYKGSKSEALKRDLQDLDVDFSGAEIYNEHFKIENRAEALGAAYVVEGSALGGMVIAKELPHCSNLEDIGNPHFFDGDRSKLKSWKNLCTLLKQQVYSPDEKALAAKKARETFEFFGMVFREVKQEVL